MIANETKGLMYFKAKYEYPSAVLVDEVQFFKEHHIQELVRIVEELDIPVIGYGLLTDFQGKLFEGSKAMVENADKMGEIKTECFYCSRKATRNMRTVNGIPVFDGQQIYVGDDDYIPTCRNCYNRLKHYTELT
jgi:thymidine kinase